MNCPACAKSSAEDARFCPACGAELVPGSGATLVDDGAPTEPTPPRSPSSGSGTGGRKRPSSSGSEAGARFVPGTQLAGRYRIVTLLGRGGMGEVYRAEDIRLEQEVALKFLPAELAGDGAALARFHREVRVARQVSHPNVCRVFDIGEAEGQPFLTMEYVDGEDLGSLLRRIGRLPPDKALEISRQLCSGLAAAHEHSVLHRDLKPANIMLDGRGRVRITDFGLAGAAGEFPLSELRAGTPGYMAPEQLAGKEATVQSDLYALGLVLYELFTGKPAFGASTLAELTRLRESSSPATPASLVRGLDPLIERAILRCLEKDPAKRPASALEIAAALPGGDPLAAALAAGETPSPEMVAAAGDKQGLRPSIAVACLVLAIAGLTGLLLLGEHIQLSGKARLDDPPTVLAEKGRELAKGLGYTATPVDTASGYTFDALYLRYIQDHNHSPNRWNTLREDHPPVFLYWYRESPRVLETEKFISTNLGGGQVTPSDPPRTISGMVYLLLSSNGRLQYLEAVPPQYDPETTTAAAPDWSNLFADAGLKMASFRRVDPTWTAPVWGDSRAAWDGIEPGASGIPLHIEAAAYRGKPVYFNLIHPWDKPFRMEAYRPTRQEKFSQMLALVFFLVILIAGLALARRNTKLGRSDRQGAKRLAVFIFLDLMLLWLVSANHVPTTHELALFIMAASWAFFASALVWILYVALEPSFRRRWPRAIISWTRVTTGKLRDPLVARDLLLGVVFGALLTLLTHTGSLAHGWLGKAPPTPQLVALYTLLGFRGALSCVLTYIPVYMFVALGIFLVLFLFRILLRREWLAAAAFVLLLASSSLLSENPMISVPVALIALTAVVLILTRLGLFALIITSIVNNVLEAFPLTTNVSRWYAGTGAVALLVIACVAVYGFYFSLAGRPILNAAALDD